ncbi:MAG: hypothetical protein PVH80_07250 [Anaerolineae bacterium]|jgi:hypothetical protein
MPDKPNPMLESQPSIYEIKIKGRLGTHWSDWFEGLTITRAEDGSTLLTGPVIDDSALHGLLKKVRDLGMPLISVNRVEPGPRPGSGQARQMSQMPDGKSRQEGDTWKGD